MRFARLTARVNGRSEACRCSSERRIAAFGLANLMAVVFLAWLQNSALTSLWCAWAAVTSVAIAAHLRREPRQTEMQMHTV